MPFNTINTLPTPTYHPTVQVSILDISDGSSHQKGKNKLSEIQEQYTNKNQEQRNPKNYKKKVATISKEDIQKIAETKMPDLNAGSLEAAMSMIAGTARSMGITVEE